MTPHIKQILKIILGVMLLIAFSKIKIDLPGNIPITGQSFAVLTLAFIYRKPLGWIIVAIYLLLGLAGLPVFADNTSGIAVFKGGTGGYLLGFLLSSYVVSFLAQKNRKSILYLLGVFVVGTLIILICGVGKLAMDYGFMSSLDYGFYPFYKGAIIKVILSVAVVFVWERYFVSS